MTTTTRTLYAALVEEPLSIAIDQPHQIAISTMSVALMAGFAARAGIVDQYVAVVLAIGIEWAWLRGVASDASSPTQWGVALNISAFVLAGLWGVLFAAELLNAFDPHSWGWWLAIIHVVPVVWLSLCSAMCHRTKLIAERSMAKAIEDEQTASAKRIRETQERLTLERLQKEQDLEMWERGKRIETELESTRKAAEDARKMRNADARIKRARNAQPVSIDAQIQNCPKCGAFIESRSQWLAARRWNKCAKCKEE